MIISTRSLTESLEKKYNILTESFIFRPTPVDEPQEWGLDTQEELEREILRYAGKKIIKMEQDSASIFTEYGYFNITLEDRSYIQGVPEECIVRSTDESLNEAQLNENPLLATAARAAIPAAIDVASDAISSAIDAKLNEEDNEDEGHTCDDSNSINEDITEDNLHIYKDVVNYLVTELDNFEGQHPCNEVESKVSGYSGDWCSEEGYSDCIEKATRAKNNYARALADVYFENAE